VWSGISNALGLFSRMVLDIHHMRELWQKGSKIAILQLLRKFSGRGAIDDRDKVYALLGLARDRILGRERISIELEYSLEVTTVFWRTALAIIEQTKSLSVFVGDLGKKNRQDLPSWVPDWSAAYENLDRRRAENAEMYDAAFGIPIQRAAINEKSMAKSLEDLRFEYDERIRDSSFMCSNQHRQECYDMLLVLVALRIGDKQKQEDNMRRYYSRHNMTLRYHMKDKFIKIPGLLIDHVTVVGEICLSDWQLSPVIQSWAVLAAKHRVLYANTWNHKDGVSFVSFGDAFRRTVCADIIQTDSNAEGLQYRRLQDTDKAAIASWFLHGKESPFGRENIMGNPELSSATKVLFKDLGSVFDDSLASAEQRGSIHAAIRLATNRRRFFVTENDYIGLGPAKMRTGDAIYVLPGGKTPLIMRRLPSDNGVRHYEVIGDCYAPGIMDGEAISMLGFSAKDTPSVEELKRRLEESHNDLRVKLNSWAKCKRLTDKDFLLEMNEAANKLSMERSGMLLYNIQLRLTEIEVEFQKIVTKLGIMQDVDHYTRMQFVAELEKAEKQIEQKRDILNEPELAPNRGRIDPRFEQAMQDICHRQQLAEKRDSLELKKVERRIIKLMYKLSQEREERLSRMGYKWYESVYLF
jgi:hypothetical protein